MIDPHYPVATRGRGMIGNMPILAMRSRKKSTKFRTSIVLTRVGCLPRGSDEPALASTREQAARDLSTVSAETFWPLRQWASFGLSGAQLL